MSFMDSILGRPAPAPMQAQTKNPEQVAPVVPEKPVEIPNPMDIYAEMFKKSEAVTTEGPPAFSLDPATLSDVSSKMDFMRGIPPDLLTKAQGGDAGALIELIQISNRNAYAAALDHSTKLTDTHLTRRGEYDKTAVKSSVKSSLLDQAIATQPNLQNKVVRQEIARIAETFAKSSPDASPQEIVEQAVRYFNDIHEAVSPQTKKNTQSAGQVQDWESFLTS